MEPCETLGQLLEVGFSSESKVHHKPSQQMVIRTAFPAASRPPLLPASPPKLLPLLLHPRHPSSGPESRQEGGRSLRGAKGPREGKEEGAAATRCQKFREAPRTPPPSPFPHPTSSRSPAGSSPNSPLDVPLNNTIRSKTRKPRLLLEPPISPFVTWIPILQECEAAKSEPAILSG